MPSAHAHVRRNAVVCAHKQVGMSVLAQVGGRACVHACVLMYCGLPVCVHMCILEEMGAGLLLLDICAQTTSHGCCRCGVLLWCCVVGLPGLVCDTGTISAVQVVPQKVSQSCRVSTHAFGWFQLNVL